MTSTSLLAGQFREGRQRSKNRNNFSKELNYQEQEDDKLEEELIDTAKDVAKKRSVANAIKHGLKLGFILRQQASDLRFDGLGFLVVLGMSVIKDFSDIITGSLSGFITTWIITPALFIFFFMRKSYFKRWFVRRFFGKYIVATILGFFPGTSIFPTYVIGTLLMRIKIDKKIKKLKSKAESVDREVAKIQSIKV